MPGGGGQEWPSKRPTNIEKGDRECKFRYFCNWLWLVETAFFCSKVYSPNGNQFIKKDHILTNVTVIFWPVETLFFYFYRQQLTDANGSNLFFNWNIFFSQSFVSDNGNEIFVYWKQYCFIPRFFLLVETIMAIREKSIFKDKPYIC